MMFSTTRVFATVGLRVVVAVDLWMAQLVENDAITLSDATGLDVSLESAAKTYLRSEMRLWA